MKKNLKKLMNLLVMVMLMVCMVGCGDKQTEDTGAEKKEITITLMNGDKKLGEIKAESGAKLEGYVTYEKQDGYEFLGWFETPTLLESSKKDLASVTYTEDKTLYGSFKSLNVTADTRVWYIVGAGGSKVLADSNWAADVDALVKDACQLKPTGKATNEFSITLDLFKDDQFQIIHDWSWDGQRGFGYFTSVDETQIANGGGLGGTSQTSNSNVMMDGNYTITLTTDPDNEAQDTMIIVRNGDPVSGQATYTANEKTQVFVKGSWVSDWSENKELTRVSGTNEFAIEMELEAGIELYFMIWEDGKDTGYGLNAEAVLDDASKAVLEESYNVKVKDAGTYVFTVDAGVMTVKAAKK